VSYADVPAGEEIIFVSHDTHMIAALHRWFSAQASDHDAHVEMMRM
jgi:hypothetical protein